MGIVCGFIAASLDGYIADRNGGLDWLTPFDDVDSGYGAFIATIGTVVMGRTTFETVAAMPGDWLYAGTRVLVVTSRPLAGAPAGVEPWHDGVPALIAHLGESAGEDVWVVGGGGLQAAFIAAGALDRLDLFVIPVLLGGGVPLFPAEATPARRLTLVETESYANGMVRLRYALS
ncbi:dihydrofolate reductase [Ancylobacter dichloromethanicus]|uniref:Dihydrofolate reductase n=1 Tax=Ancylobacter dichloromethanicus TaxID=518825 RepID=A0A9W6J4T4_9HYPH|nr:dihydrofolate reductase family protein [Ancylobacter dichloromethanicus]MBS7553742.1 dihydrofolate reductase [Ancylobacter dichloromethanicus]GLK70846.1 dihydrofolate reductase [Ancylobacter dichloromethanicus]